MAADRCPPLGQNLGAERNPRRGFVDPTELKQPLEPLTATEARKLIDLGPLKSRGAQVLREVPADWQRNPFLLTLLLHTATEPGAAASPRAWERETLLRAHSTFDIPYSRHVLYEGLSEAQQDSLKAIARDRIDARECDLSLLRAAGLIDRRDERWVLVDPVLRDYLPSPLRIHHISDLHFGERSAPRVDAKAGGAIGKRLAEGVGQGDVRDSYVEHIEGLTPAAKPHLLVVSGDVVEKGTDEEYQSARKWLDQAQAALGSHPGLGATEPRLLLAGGNHDVDWSKAAGPDGARQRHERFATEMKDYSRPKLEEDPASRQLTVVRYKDIDLEVVLLGSAEYGGEIDQELKELIDKLRSSWASAADELKREEIGKRLGHIDPGLVHHQDLQRVRQHDWRGDVRIAALHHPVTQLPAIVEVAMFGGLLNAGQVKDALMAVGIDLVLHGHVHHPFVAEERWPKHKSRPLWLASAPTLGSVDTYEAHGFTEVEIVREGDAYTLQVRTWRRDGDSFKPTEHQLGPAPVEIFQTPID